MRKLVFPAILGLLCGVACGSANQGFPENDAEPPDASLTPDATGGTTDAAPTDASTMAQDAAPEAASAAPIPLSTPGIAGFSPSLATHDAHCLVAWHEFGDGGTHVVYSVIKAGTPGVVRAVPDAFTRQLQPQVASTPGGYVVAYQANDGARDVVRAVELDLTGAVVAGPDTITAAGTGGSAPRVATLGAQEAFSWLGANGHFFALRGPMETLAATPVGTTLQALTLLNVPHIALDASGTLFLAYRDGGTQATDWDVLLVTRPSHGTFGAPANVSNSPGRVSDDVTVTLDKDGALQIVWVEQDLADPNFFEVTYSFRAPGGALSAPARFGNQGAMMWMPSAVPGRAAWNGGGAGIGAFFTAQPGSAPKPFLAPLIGNQVSLGLEPDGTLDVALTENTQPRRITYARLP